jgi:hypothetical protein
VSGTLRTQSPIHESCPVCIVGVKVGASGGNPDDDLRPQSCFCVSQHLVARIQCAHATCDVFTGVRPALSSKRTLRHASRRQKWPTVGQTGARFIHEKGGKNVLKREHILVRGHILFVRGAGRTSLTTSGSPTLYGTSSVARPVMNFVRVVRASHVGSLIRFQSMLVLSRWIEGRPLDRWDALRRLRETNCRAGKLV